MQIPGIVKTTNILLFFISAIVILYIGKPFLVPLTLATIIAMLFLPMCKWMERKRLSRGLSSLFAVLTLAVLIAGVLALLAWQLSSIMEDVSGFKEYGNQLLEKMKQLLNDSFGISRQQQDEMLKKQQSGGAEKAGALVAMIMEVISGLLVDTILVFVYTFLILFLRKHLKDFILRIVKSPDKETASIILNKAASSAGKYVSGLGLMIVMLWVLYGIGFTIIGIKNPIFYAVLCGILEIVPFVGNITGTGVTVLMALSQGGSITMVLGILATYGSIQFIQTYILEPLVVGSQVKLNPLFTIIAIVVGELIWGVPGMVLAIPVTGIAKVIFDHVDSLKPYGYLLGETKK